MQNDQLNLTYVLALVDTAEHLELYDKYNISVYYVKYIAFANVKMLPAVDLLPIMKCACISPIMHSTN